MSLLPGAGFHNNYHDFTSFLSMQRAPIDEINERPCTFRYYGAFPGPTHSFHPPCFLHAKKPAPINRAQPWENRKDAVVRVRSAMSVFLTLTGWCHYTPIVSGMQREIFKIPVFALG